MAPKTGRQSSLGKVVFSRVRFTLGDSPQSRTTASKAVNSSVFVSELRTGNRNGDPDTLRDHSGPKRIVAVAQVDSFHIAENGGREGSTVGAGAGVRVDGNFVGDIVGNTVLGGVGVVPIVGN